MSTNRKNPNADLRKYYTVFLELGLIATLVIFIVAAKVTLAPSQKDLNLTDEQETVQIEDVIQTKQIEKPPPPPRPPVPVEVPNDEIIEDEIININAELDLDEALDLPPPPPEEEEEVEDFFVAVEEMPELLGSLQDLQGKADYPDMARKAGVEGMVVVQFIVNEQGRVENPVVVRGIGAGCDEEALRVVKQAQFKPGKQRGKPVRVQYSVPIIFRLKK